MSTTSRQPKTEELEKRLRSEDLRDLKFLYDGKSTGDPSLEDLSAEVLSILEADDLGVYVDIEAKLK
jgi:hypothetical protein